MSAEWELAQLVGYLKTWSAYQSYLSKTASDPLDAIAPKLEKAWGLEKRLEVIWPLGLRCWRVKNG